MRRHLVVKIGLAVLIVAAVIAVSGYLIFRYTKGNEQ